MFTLQKEQKICQIGQWRVGGQPGDNPPLLISSMFHKGDKLLESRKEGKFDKTKAIDYIKRQEELSEQTGLPAITALVANTAEEMKRYIDFFVSVSDKPFGIDMWVQEPRIASVRYVAELGLMDRLLYNSITPWDKDIPGQVTQLKELGVKHVVVQVYDDNDPTPQGRLTSFRKMMEAIGTDTFPSVLVDTSVMNLPATSFSSVANRLIKEEFGVPAGLASSNGTFMWKSAREMWGSEGFSAMNVAAQAISTMFWSDLIFYGPQVTAPRIFPAVVSATLLLATLVYQETGRLPSNPEHPLYKFFGDFAEKLQASK
ncbi:MAG: tetrahydromethanopterin S-methyltransferase subunit H [Peptococcaceae bacterium]|nr:tetrahydromethanopterin S-methyltransferase subunit H [Peptococcaceae bacterium]